MVSRNILNDLMPLSADSLESLTARPLNVEGLSSTQETLWLEVISKMDEVYAGLLKDEAELQEKNTALEDAKRFIDSVLSAMSDLLIVCDRNGHILQVNRAVCDMTGESEPELVRKHIRDLVISDADKFDFRAEMPHEFEGRLGTQAGESDLLTLTRTTRKDRRGRNAGFVITGHPIGELRRAYAALEKAHADLKQSHQRMIYAEKMASLGRLVAGVAHELNNPISFVYSNMHSMKLYCKQMREYLTAVQTEGESARLAEMRRSLGIDEILDDLPPLVEAVEEGAERASEIVRGLRRMSFSGPEAHQIIDLSANIISSVTWARRGQKTDINVSLALGSELYVYGQDNTLQQVSLNIIQNAFDAMRDLPDRRMDIETRREGDQIIARFRDYGLGIPEASLSKIFDPFFTTKEIGEGTGLGLWVSYDVVRAHSGELTAENHPDGGAVLTMSLPAAQ